jgi:hypothetical protein
LASLADGVNKFGRDEPTSRGAITLALDFFQVAMTMANAT